MNDIILNFFTGLGVNELLVAIVLFAIGLVALIKGGDWFVDGATGVAHRFHIPEILIGATVVAIGTTLPEVMVSATSAAKGLSDIAYGNAVGSVICNTALISALTFAIRPSKVDKKSFGTPVIFFFAAAIFYAAVALIFGEFSRITGIILLATFLIYMFITTRQALKNPSLPDADAAETNEGENDKDEGASPLWKDLLWLIIGAAVIAVGASLLVDNGTLIAKGFGVPDSVIALTFVALGTSLPELVTAITALAKGHSSLSLGNIVGANLFNLVLVSGMAITIHPFSIPAGKMIGDMNAALVVDLPVMLAVMAIMTLPTIIRGKMSRLQGILLLATYVGYCVFQFAL